MKCDKCDNGICNEFYPLPCLRKIDNYGDCVTNYDECKLVYKDALIHGHLILHINITVEEEGDSND